MNLMIMMKLTYWVLDGKSLLKKTILHERITFTLMDME